MRLIRIAGSALAAGVLLVACAEQTPVDPAEPVAVAGPSLDWTNNPDNGNPRIFRGETHWGSCWTDPTNGLRACHATVPLGGGSEPDCGLQQEGDPIEFQDVGEYVPDDPFSSWIHEVVKGDVWITIRDLNQPGDCFGNAVVAEGWGTFMYNDNDIYGTAENNANAWGFKANANRLTAPDGSRLVYNGHIRFNFSNTGGFFHLLSVKVNVH